MTQDEVFNVILRLHRDTVSEVDHIKADLVMQWPMSRSELVEFLIRLGLKALGDEPASKVAAAKQLLTRPKAAPLP